jgi:hypothetical protein
MNPSAGPGPQGPRDGGTRCFFKQLHQGLDQLIQAIVKAAVALGERLEDSHGEAISWVEKLAGDLALSG